MTQMIAKYFKTQPVLKAWLLGTYSRGEETPDSNVDILMMLDHSQPVGLEFLCMYEDLKELLGRGCGFSDRPFPGFLCPEKS